MIFMAQGTDSLMAILVSPGSQSARFMWPLNIDMHMKNHLLSLSFIMMSNALFGQLNVDFSNGSLTENPPWIGTLDKFIIEHGLLRLADDRAGEAYLSTMSHVLASTQWDFWLRLSFIPSDNNHPRVYIVSDQADLTGPVNGYFIQVGKSGSDKKRLYLRRQDGHEVMTILEGRDNLSNLTNNRIRIRVIRDELGLWQLFADPQGGHAFLPQGAVYDNTHTSTSWFGLYCRYTVSNSRGFYFDDLRVGEVIPEPPPKIVRIRAQSQAAVDVYFNRVVTAASAANPMAYRMDGGIGHPLVASRDPENPLMVRLLFRDHLIPNHLYKLFVEGVMGIGDELMTPFAGELMYYVSSRFDVVFNELMVNSRPPAGLPPHDWLELYNTTDLPLPIEGWQISYGSGLRQIPDVVLPAKSHLVLTTEEALPEMKDFGHVMAVPGLPANALTIGGSQLILQDAGGQIISHVNYDESWYNDPVKARGGWSLEKIDPYNFCQGKENWRASNDSRGGTPGANNSVLGNNPDFSNPEPRRIALLDERTIEIIFSGSMDDRQLADPSRYTISDGMGHPEWAEPVAPCYSRVRLGLDSPFIPGRIYELQVCETLISCAGNQVNPVAVRLGLPETPYRHDLVINEILFNPPPYGARYVELYNRSERIVDMAGMLLSSADTLAGTLESVQEISHGSYLVFPGDYLVLTADPDAVMRTFAHPGPGLFAGVSTMPRMTNAGGSIVLVTKGLEVIDSLTYHEQMHLPMLAHTRGVALERVYPDWSSNDSGNWHSAASNWGFGTPGMQNSQYLSLNEVFPGKFEVSPDIFVPDGSGEHDLLTIHYALDEPGFVAHVRVFDREGHEVRTLSRGLSLGTSGMITWDGSTNHGLKASAGIYVIHLDVFSESGRVFSKRLTAVLGSRLR